MRSIGSHTDSLVHWLLHPPPLLLVRNGQLQHRNLRAELITKDDLLEQLREQGVEEVASVKKCFLESDGKLSVVRSGSEPSSGRPNDRKA